MAREVGRNKGGNFECDDIALRVLVLHTHPSTVKGGGRVSGCEALHSWMATQPTGLGWVDIDLIVRLYERGTCQKGQEPNFQSAELFNALCITSITCRAPIGLQRRAHWQRSCPMKRSLTVLVHTRHTSSAENAECNVTKLVVYVRILYGVLRARWAEGRISTKPGT